MSTVEVMVMRGRWARLVVCPWVAVMGFALLGSSAPAAAAACPSVDPVTHVVSPSPTPGVDWSGCDLRLADLRSAELAGANLAGASLEAANVRWADLSGADLTSAYVSWAWLRGANLTDATLVGAIMDTTSLVNVDLTGADLADAWLQHAVLRGVTLDETNLAGAYFGLADLTDAHGCAIVGEPAALPLGYSITAGCLTFVLTYEVTFYNPLSNQPVLNVGTAGRVIPIRFAVRDALAERVTDLTAAELLSYRQPCPVGAFRDPIEWYSSGGSMDLINLGDGRYRYNFSSRLRWAGTCRGVEVDLGDAGLHVVDIRFHQ